MSCVSVCLSVTTLAATSFVLTLKVRYVGVYYRLFLDFNSWIFDKTFRSKVMAWKSQYPNEYILAATSYGADAATFHQTGPSLVLSSLTVGYKQPGIVRQRATAVYTGLRLLLWSLPYTFRYIFVNACAFSKPRARATTLIAPRVCTLVL